MRLSRSTQNRDRKAAAAVEFAFVAPFLILVLIGIWELGRIIQVNQILENAARDGARLAAQSTIVTNTGAYTQIRFSSGNPSVQDTIRDYLISSGITNLDGLSITFAFTEGDLSRPDPYLGLKNERFRIQVSIPYENVRWTNLSLFNPATIRSEIHWQMMVDDPFTLNTSIPGWNGLN